MLYEKKTLESLSFDELKEVAHQMGVRVGHTKDPMTLIYEILDAQAEQQAAIPTERTKKEKAPQSEKRERKRVKREPEKVDIQNTKADQVLAAVNTVSLETAKAEPLPVVSEPKQSKKRKNKSKTADKQQDNEPTLNLLPVEEIEAKEKDKE